MLVTALALIVSSLALAGPSAAQDPNAPANDAPGIEVEVLAVSTWATRVRVTCSEPAEISLAVEVRQTAAQNGRYDTSFEGDDSFACGPGAQNRLVGLDGSARLRVGEATAIISASVGDGPNTGAPNFAGRVLVTQAPPPRINRPSDTITIGALRRRIIDNEVRFFVNVVCEQQIDLVMTLSVTQLIGRDQHLLLASGGLPCIGTQIVEIERAFAEGQGLDSGRAMVSITAHPAGPDPAPTDVASARRRTRLPIPIPAAPGS